jgi:hypothetical protein
MKQIIRFTLIFLLTLALLMAYLNEREKVQLERSNTNEWKEKAEQLSQIPDYNQLAEDFVLAMNGGEGGHESLLTGVALEEYEQAVKDSGENIQDAYIDTSLIDSKVIMVQTKVNEDDDFQSKVMYELDMTTVADNPDEGIIDQRIITYIMEIDWDQSKVERYEIVWFDDTLGSESEVAE